MFTLLAAGDVAVFASVLLAVAAVITAIGAFVNGRRNAAAAVEAADNARTQAQTGEDDSYVNRSLKAMQESQAWLREENKTLRQTIDRQRDEIEELHRDLGDMRQALETAKSQLATCQNTCDRMLERVSLLEDRRKNGT